jgi:uncharacterized phage protein (TIGR01671 family)
MREIKFRAKRIDNGRWVYGQYFKTPLTDENSGTLPEAGWFFLTGETRHCIVQDGVSFVIDINTLGQYVGLKDKNGNEIYESDVVKGYWWEKGESHRHIGKITYGMSAFKVVGVKQYLGMSDELSPVYEVIGNIYDNSELLES